MVMSRAGLCAARDDKESDTKSALCGGIFVYHLEHQIILSWTLGRVVRHATRSPDICLCTDKFLI